MKIEYWVLHIKEMVFGRYLKMKRATHNKGKQMIQKSLNSQAHITVVPFVDFTNLGIGLFRKTQKS